MTRKHATHTYTPRSLSHRSDRKSKRRGEMTSDVSEQSVGETTRRRNDRKPFIKVKNFFVSLVTKFDFKKDVCKQF